MKKTFYLTNFLYNAHLDIRVEEEVAVITDVYSHDLFNLVVDFGSALGLWLGFSALSFIDYTVKFLSLAKSKLQKKKVMGL